MFFNRKRFNKKGCIDAKLHADIFAYIQLNESIPWLAFPENVPPAPYDCCTEPVYHACPAPATYEVGEAAPAPTASAPKASAQIELGELLKKTDAGFAETLLKLIDRSGKKDSEIYRRANISRQHFSKIRNNYAYHPTKTTALAFSIALELDMEETKDLIGRAGYALTSSSRLDLIVMYFIEHRKYDIFEINNALYEFDQSLLGA